MADALFGAALESGTGVVVVHGLDPTTLSKEAANAKSNLVPAGQEPGSEADQPALCGALVSAPSGSGRPWVPFKIVSQTYDRSHNSEP